MSSVPIDQVARRFGAAVKRAREAKGWSVRDGALELGITASGLQEIENGNRSPRIDTAAYIARKLRLSIDKVAGL